MSNPLELTTADVVDEVLTYLADAGARLDVRGFYRELIRAFSYRRTTRVHFNSFTAGKKKIADRVGCCPKAVRGYLDKLDRLGVLRVSDGHAHTKDQKGRGFHVEFIFDYANSTIERYQGSLIARRLEHIVDNSSEEGGQHHPSTLTKGGRRPPCQADGEGSRLPSALTKGGPDPDLSADEEGTGTPIAMAPLKDIDQSIAMDDENNPRVIAPEELNKILKGPQHAQMLRRIEAAAPISQRPRYMKIAERLTDLGFDDVEGILFNDRHRSVPVADRERLDYLEWILFNKYSGLTMGGAVRKKLQNSENVQEFRREMISRELKEQLRKMLAQYRPGDLVGRDNPATGQVDEAIVEKLGDEITFYNHPANVRFRFNTPADLKGWRIISRAKAS